MRRQRKRLAKRIKQFHTRHYPEVIIGIGFLLFELLLAGIGFALVHVGSIYCTWWQLGLLMGLSIAALCLLAMRSMPRYGAPPAGVSGFRKGVGLSYDMIGAIIVAVFTLPALWVGAMVRSVFDGWVFALVLSATWLVAMPAGFIGIGGFVLLIKASIALARRTKRRWQTPSLQ